MLMRLPESGSLAASLPSRLGETVADGTGIAVDGVGETQLAEALDALSRGDVDGLQEVPGGVGAAALRDALQADRRGDPAWRRPFQWSAA